MENLEKIREALMEAIAETNEEYMDRYFSGEEFTYDEIRYALRMNVRSRRHGARTGRHRYQRQRLPDASRDSGYVLSGP